MAMPVHLLHWQERSDMIHMWYVVVFREPEMEPEMELWESVNLHGSLQKH